MPADMPCKEPDRHFDRYTLTVYECQVIHEKKKWNGILRQLGNILGNILCQNTITLVIYKSVIHFSHIDM